MMKKYLFIELIKLKFLFLQWKRQESSRDEWILNSLLPEVRADSDQRGGGPRDRGQEQGAHQEQIRERTLPDQRYC